MKSKFIVNINCIGFDYSKEIYKSRPFSKKIRKFLDPWGLIQVASKNRHVGRSSPDFLKAIQGDAFWDKNVSLYLSHMAKIFLGKPLPTPSTAIFCPILTSCILTGIFCKKIKVVQNILKMIIFGFFGVKSHISIIIINGRRRQYTDQNVFTTKFHI